MNYSVRSCGCLLGASIVVAALPAVAEPAAPSDSDLQEIVVTAQRREESLSKTPVSVAVVSADELAKNQVVTEQDLRFATPGLTVRATLNSNQLGFALRGQSQDAYSNTRPGVLPYFNDVQISASGQGSGSTALYDLQSVQVLKGPQGTLFGRSATGGAVLYTTAKPTDEFEGYVSALGGDYGQQKYEAAISGPLLGDTLEGRLAGYFQKRDGFQYNIYNNSDIGGVERAGARISLTAKIGDRIRNEFVFDFLHSSGQNTIGVIGGLQPFTGGAQPPYLPIQLLYSGTSTPVATATGEAVLAGFVPPAYASLVPGYYQNYFSNPHHPAIGLTGFLAWQQSVGPYVVNSDAPDGYGSKNSTLSNTTTIELGDTLHFKNIFGYVNQRSLNSTEGDGSPYGIVTGSAYTISNWGGSDELQLLGTAAADRFSYVTGLFLSDEKETQDLATSFFDLVFGGENQVNAFSITHKTVAPYGQGTYQINDHGLGFTLGARYTDERVGITQDPQDSSEQALGPVPPPGYSYVQSHTYRNLSWQVGLQDQLNPNWLLYAVSRRAYKSGGYNGTVPPKVGLGDVGGNAYDEERVTDIELGSKFQGIMAGMPVRTNIALYNLWEVNSQRRDFTLVGASPAALTVNVPTGKTYGVEFDAQIKPINHLTVGGSFTYTHASFGTQPVIVFGVPQIFDQVPDTPKTVGSVFAELAFVVVPDYEVSLRGDVYDQTMTYGDSRSINNVGTELPSYTVTNFRVGIDQTKVHWSVNANVKNAFNRVYYVGDLPTGVTYQINTIIPGEPRTFTVEGRYKFH